MKCSLCDRDKPAEMMTKAQWACRQCWRGYMRFKRYGITPVEYESMERSQGGLCAICASPNFVPKKSKDVTSLAVDHDRNTGRVRGLLCDRCNRGLGYFRENVVLLGKAALYLQETERK